MTTELTDYMIWVVVTALIALAAFVVVSSLLDDRNAFDGSARE